MLCKGFLSPWTHSASCGITGTIPLCSALNHFATSSNNRVWLTADQEDLVFTYCTALEQGLALPSCICFLICEMGILILISLQGKQQGIVKGNPLKCNSQPYVLG